jgi:hypothetical protein
LPSCVICGWAAAASGSQRGLEERQFTATYHSKIIAYHGKDHMKTHRYLIALAPALALAGTPVEASSPFATMQGSWAGTGSITFEGGQSERLRCNARYSGGRNGDSLGLNLRCASPSARVDLSGRLSHRDGRVSGSWSETSYGAQGTAYGRSTLNNVSLRLGGSITGAMTMSVSGSRQSVSISTRGTSLRAIHMTLARR